MPLEPSRTLAVLEVATTLSMWHRAERINSSATTTQKKGHACSLVDAANITAICGAIWSLLSTCSATQPTQTCIGRRGAGAEARGGDDDRVRKRRRVVTNPFGGDLTHVWRPLSPTYSTNGGLLGFQLVS